MSRKNPMPSDGDRVQANCDRCRESFTYVSGEDDHAHSGLYADCYEYKKSLDFISPSTRKSLTREAVESHDDLAIYEDRTTFKVYRVSEDD